MRPTFLAFALTFLAVVQADPARADAPDSAPAAVADLCGPDGCPTAADGPCAHDHDGRLLRHRHCGDRCRALRFIRRCCRGDGPIRHALRLRSLRALFGHRLRGCR